MPAAHREGDPHPGQTAAGGRDRLRLGGLPRGLDRQDHRGGRGRPRHLLPLLRGQTGHLRRGRRGPEPARPARHDRRRPCGRHAGSRPNGPASGPSSASPPSTRPCTGSSGRPSSSRPAPSGCTTPGSSTATSRGSRRPSSAARSAQMDPTVAAWALMGIGELIGMRWVLWDEEGAEPAAGRPARRARRSL